MDDPLYDSSFLALLHYNCYLNKSFYLGPSEWEYHVHGEFQKILREIAESLNTYSLKSLGIK